jgi:predicted nucleic acid-binding protein
MLQSLNEFSAVVRKKRLMSLATLKKIIEYHNNAFELESPTVEDLLQALQANEDHNLPIWDALLWATARRSGCKIIFSEDFQDGRELGGVRFVNPFKLSRRELRDFSI